MLLGLPQMCQAALAGPTADRAAALDRSCGDDAELRAEVDALLGEQPRADRLFDTPAWEAAAIAFADTADTGHSPRLSPGDRLGPYAIEELVAVGGMGEVYKATDTRLDRTVAIKVLPPEMAAGDAPWTGPGSSPGSPIDDMRERFELEARAVSRLNHPHICALYDIGSAAPEGSSQPPVDYLVMEYLEGQTLAERMTPSPAEAREARRTVPIRAALEYGSQIADALAAAHRRGIVHCDLKPGNVMLTRDGVKLLDFGIARVKRAALVDVPGAAQDPAGRAAAGAAMLGTIHYMAPEQFAGKEPDPRSDLFAFGALLFEMLTGTRAFDGTSPASVVTSILGDTPPPVSALQPLAPPALDELVRRCLAKDPDARWDSARLAADELGRIGRDLARGAAPARADSAAIAALPARMRSRWRWLAAFAALTVAAVTIAVLATRHDASVASRPLERFDLNLGANFEPHPRVTHAVLSPDGSRLVFTDRGPTGKVQLVARRLDRSETTTLVERATSVPFFSPDGRWVAFVDGARLFKVNIDGGAPVAVCDAQFSSYRGGSWGDDGTIVVAPDMTGGLVRVPSSGGVPVPVTMLDAARHEATHRWPQVLPGSRAVLFTAHRTAAYYDDASIEVQRLDTGERKTLHRGGYFGRYLPSGHLVFVRHNTLYAAPMDLERLELTGPPVPVVNEVVADAGTGRLEFSASDTGAALCFTGVWQALQHSPVWYDRTGHAEQVAIPPGPYADPRVSKRGSIALTLGGYTSRLLGIEDPGLREPRQLPSSGNDFTPLWAPDGVHVAYGCENDQGVPNVCWRRADGAGRVVRLTNSPYLQWASSFSPDGGTLAFTEVRPDTDADIWTVSLDLRDPDQPVPGTPQAWLTTAFAESEPAFSPDGRWIAYVSVEAGRPEIYVRGAEGGERRWPASRGVGTHPVWVPGRDEIAFVGAGRAVMVTPFRVVRGEIVSGSPALWPNARLAPFEPSYTIRNFDLSPDGKRVLVLGPPDPPPAPPRTSATLFLNFFDELRRRTAR
jgi:serine/threonine-protein kinase